MHAALHPSLPLSDKKLETFYGTSDEYYWLRRVVFSAKRAQWEGLHSIVLMAFIETGIQRDDVGRWAGLVPQSVSAMEA